MEHETSDVKKIIRTEIKHLLQVSDIVNTAKAHEKSTLEFLCDQITDNNDLYFQIETCITESQLRFDLNPFKI